MNLFTSHGFGWRALPVAILMCSALGAEADAPAKPASKPAGAASAASESIGRDYVREIELLQEAGALLAGVKDEEGAKKAADKISRDFNGLPPLVVGNEKEIMALAEARNGVSLFMVRLKKQPWFSSSGLQKAWTLMTGAFSRRRANSPGQRRMRIPRPRS